MAKEQKRSNEFKRRIRIKGRIVKKSFTKSGNIRLKIAKADEEYNFVVVKSHKERFALAEALKKKDFVSAEGINKFRAVICTKLKKIENVDESRQVRLVE